MSSHFQIRRLVLILILLVVGCTASNTEIETSTESESFTIRQQTPGRSNKFTQFELDVAYRKQALEYARVLLDPEKGFSFCCVVFYRDIEMLGKVIAHFEEHVPDSDIDDYGIHILEHDKEYFVHLWERYKVETQYEIEGFWHPGVSEEGIRQFGYLVDRETREILEFSEMSR